MDNWVVELEAGFAWAYARIGDVLHGFGQDNEVVKLGVLALLGFVGLTLIWAALLGLVRLLAAPFQGRPEAAPARRAFAAPGFAGSGFGGSGFGGSGFGGSGFGSGQGSGSAAPSPAKTPGHLNVVPSAAPAPRLDMPAFAPRLARSSEETKPSDEGPSRSSFADELDQMRSAPDLRLAQAAGGQAQADPLAPPRSRSGLHQIKVRTLPRLSDRGSVVSARPEWTGKVALTSWQDAGAVEICRVLRRTPTGAGAQTVRAVDYRICGLPRVDEAGRRQPDALVYTVADRGLLPKGAMAGQPRR